MKWIKNNIKFERGNYWALIARYDGERHWFTMRALATQQSQKSNFKELGNMFEAEICEVKNLWDDNDAVTEEDVVVFMFMPSGECRFYRSTPEGSLIEMTL